MKTPVTFYALVAVFTLLLLLATTATSAVLLPFNSESRNVIRDAANLVVGDAYASASDSKGMDNARVKVGESVQTITIMLPMRDKTTALKTTLYFYPSIVQKQPVSSILYRTPYNIDASHNYLVKMTEITQFVVVAQDFRGRYGSNGTFSFWRDAAQDAYDTMAWISTQTWSTGKIYR